MGLGIVLCCITCVGHIAAEAINGFCLCCVSFPSSFFKILFKDPCINFSVTISACWDLFFYIYGFLTCALGKNLIVLLSFAKNSRWFPLYSYICVLDKYLSWDEEIIGTHQSRSWGFYLSQWWNLFLSHIPKDVSILWNYRGRFNHWLDIFLQI